MRYPAAGEFEASRPRPELLERCFLPTSATTHLQHENPRIVRFTSARICRTDPRRVLRTLRRARGEDATRAPTRPSPCRNTMCAREPRVEPRLTTRFQLRLARHRSEFFGSETSSAGALHLVTALSAANETARAQPLTPLSLTTSRDDPEAIEVRRARTDSLDLTSMRTKYPGPRRLPPTRRGPNATLARRESNPCRETARLSRRGPHVRHMFTPRAKDRVRKIGRS